MRDELAGRVREPQRRLLHIPIHTRPVHQPQRVGLEVPPGRRVVVAHPVLVEAGFALEPLAGEPCGGEGAGAYVHPAEGLVGGGPDLHPAGVGREDRPADVVGADEGDDAAFDDRDRFPPVPDVFTDEGSQRGVFGESGERGVKPLAGLGFANLLCVFYASSFRLYARRDEKPLTIRGESEERTGVVGWHPPYSSLAILRYASWLYG